MYKSRWMVCAVLAAGVTARAQEAATNLAPLTVVSTPLTEAWGFGQVDSAGRALGATPGVLVLSQGGASAQNDLSIRGSSFSGAGLSIGGLSLRNPQTEHFNAELPLPAGLFSAPRVATGLDQARAADGHLVGSVALEPAPIQPTRRLSAGGGERDRHWETARLQQPLTPDAADGRWSVGAFGANERASALDYRDNDLELWNAGGQIQYAAPETQVDVMAGTQHKEFGARGYYGVNDSLPAEEEVDDSLVLFSGRRGTLDGNYSRVTAQWREIDDEYRILPAIFYNRTESRVLAAAADGRLDLCSRSDLQWRAGVEDEDMDGLTLGDQDRQRGHAQLLPSVTAGALRLSAGLRSEVFTDDSPAFLPLGGVEVALCPRTTVYASYTETVRQPSFTELSYDSPGSLGDAGLERQEHQAIEVGVRRELTERMRGHAAVFQHEGRESVDWVRKTPESVRFEAVNLDDVDTVGAEVGLAGELNSRVGLSAQYTWMDKDSDSDVYASRYVLDYAKHLAQLSATWRVCQSLRLTGTQALRWQEDNPLRESDEFGAVGAVAAHVSLPSLPQAVLTLALDNAWDEDFQTFAGQDVSGRRASASLTLDW